VGSNPTGPSTFMIESIQYQRELAVAEKIAQKAGEVILQYFDGDQQTMRKADGSPVTIADKLINSMVIEELSREFPNDGIIGEEESTSEYGDGRKWLCDPIDGTIAYTWGIPTSLFSLGLVLDGQPQIGVVYDPYLDRLYKATKNGDSYCNGDKLSVSNNGLEDGIVAVTSNVKKISHGLNYVKELEVKNALLATFSGAIYKAVLVARGRFVGYIEHGVGAHDMAAVELIVERAGGKVTGIDGSKLDYSRPFNGAVVSNGVVHNELVQIAQK
jgi:fructose-1,6-bisphosphatase/inositol monophosphatase family enzyme